MVIHTSLLRGHRTFLPCTEDVDMTELARVSVCLCWVSCWPSAPLSRGCLGPQGALISQTNGSCATASLAALIYLPDMCFLVCFLSPARHGRWYWAVSTALLHSCQMNQSLQSAPRPCLVFSTSINAGALRKGLVLFLLFIRKRIALSR